MANLYLIGAPQGRNGLELAKADPNALVVLLQDGVYLDTSELARMEKRVYAVRKDVEKRGLAARVAATAELIDYSKLVDLLFENKVINFA